MILAIIGWILFGFTAGIVAKSIMPGKDGGGFILTTLLGIGGAITGGFLGNIFGYGINKVGDPGFVMSLLFAVLGSIFILAIFRLGSDELFNT